MMRMKLSQNEISAQLDSIISKWRKIGNETQGRARLYAVGANCIWEYGVTSSGTFCFYLESPIPFGCGRQLCTKNIQSKEEKENGFWFLRFELLEIEDLAIFAKLIEDLISESAQYSEDKQCIHAVVSRFELWRSMMSHAAQHKSEEKGLWGELFALRKLLLHVSAMDAIRAWTGPEYEAQDYKFSDKWIEVKTVGSNSFVAKISSINQLISVNTGYLYVIYADDDEFDEKAESVHKIYSDICKTLKNESTNEAFELFHEKIRDFKYLGFVAEERTKYVCKAERYFEVDETFPRLEIHGDALAIGSVVYELKLDALKEREINDLWQRLSAMTF